MLKVFDRNTRLEMFADYIERLSPAEFRMEDCTRCFAGHVEDCFGVTLPEQDTTCQIDKLQQLLGLTWKQAEALFRWRVGDPRRPTMAEAAARLRRLIRVKLPT